MIFLTRNEVRHAREWYPNVELFVVTEIRVTGHETDSPKASEGTAHVCQNWLPAEADLTPVEYAYVTRLTGGATIQWTPASPR